MEQTIAAGADNLPSSGTVARAPEARFTKMPGVGEPAPWFHAATPDNPRFSFDTVAGRRVVLSFFGDMRESELRQLLMQMQAVAPAFTAAGCVFFGVSTSHGNSHAELVKEILPDGYLFLDRDRSVSQAYGVAFSDENQVAYRPASFLMDERLRITDVAPMTSNAPALHIQRLVQALHALPAMELEQAVGVPAPVLIVPRVFEPDMCQTLINYYQREGGEASGFMRDVNGRTVLVHDPRHKTRRDRIIEDTALRTACRNRIHHCLVPEIAKAFQFTATRIERYLVACYEAEDAGHFRPHRDNTTLGTAHRRFAVSLNLNTGDYQGGLLRFPEFGRQLYQAPAGGAVVFSCSLLHEATPVTSGQRYAFLPFLYDDAAAELRERNRKFIE